MPPITNALLGYPPDARLLIVNADDFGLCQAVNAAIMPLLQQALLLQGAALRSASLMLPCPWSPQAVQFLGEHPEIPHGVHLTVMADPTAYRWGALAPAEKVPSLLDRAGYFYNFDDLHARLAQVSRAELEIEFRAQIEAAFAAGLRPAHLDWHALRITAHGANSDIFDLLLRLAREYGLALRVMGAANIARLRALGLPAADHDFIDSFTAGFSYPTAQRRARFDSLLRELPAGLNEWAAHPGLDSPELRALEPDGEGFRQSDFDYWSSPETQALIERAGILITSYRALQPFWQ